MSESRNRPYDSLARMQLREEDYSLLQVSSPPAYPESKSGSKACDAKQEQMDESAMVLSIQQMKAEQIKIKKREELRKNYLDVVRLFTIAAAQEPQTEYNPALDVMSFPHADHDLNTCAVQAQVCKRSLGVFQPGLTKSKTTLQELAQHIVNKKHDQLEEKLQSLFLSDPKLLKELFKYAIWVPNSDKDRDPWPGIRHTLNGHSERSGDKRIIKTVKSYFEKLFGVEAGAESFRQIGALIKNLASAQKEWRKQQQREAEIARQIEAEVAKRRESEMARQKEAVLSSLSTLFNEVAQFTQKPFEFDKGDSKKEPSRP